MKKFPVIILSLNFIAGLITGSYFRPPVIYLYIYIFILIILSIIYFIYLKEINIFLSVYVLSGIFLIGIYYYTPVNDLSLNEQLNREDIILYGSVKDVAVSNKEKYKFTAQSDSLKFKGRIIQLKRNFYCVIKSEDGRLVLIPGNKISLKGVFIRGRTIRNPGERNYEEYLLKTGIQGYVYSDYQNIKVTNHSEIFPANVIYRSRKYLADEIEEYHDPGTAALLKGLILGDKSEIEKEIREDFINTGTAHIIAVSGLHVGYIILIFVFITGRMNLYFRSLLISLGVICFIFISGASPSVLRASFMALIILIAFLTNRSSNIFNTLALSALILLIIEPSQLFLPGFQLSYAAVISIAVIYPLIKNAIDKINFRWMFLKNTLLLLAVSFAAQIGTLPFVLYYFSKLSLVSLITNLLVIPAAGLIVGTSFVTIILIPVIPFIAGLFASANMLLSSILFYLIKISGDAEFSFLWIYDFSIVDGLIFYIMFSALLFFYLKSGKLFPKLIFTVLVFFSILLFSAFDENPIGMNDNLYCYMIDVGQGDAILLRFPSGKSALIDAGDASETFDSGENIIEPLLNYSGVYKIDYAFVSHIDADHYSGFVSLVQKGLIKKLFKPVSDSSAQDLKFEAFLKRKKMPFSYYSNNILQIDNARIYFLEPGLQNNSNDRSGILQLIYGHTKFLFMGDAGFKTEENCIKKYGEFLKSDVLKVSHHGSSKATSEVFLNNVLPEISLISAGEKNKFGHPSKATLDRLQRINSKIYRTDLEGGILLISDGFKINKINWKN